MTITAKQIDRSNIVCTFRPDSAPVPDPALVFSAYTGDAAKGAIFSDNPALDSRVFEFPAVGLMWVFERGRIRLEDRGHRTPDESKLAFEYARVVSQLFPGAVLEAYGFNYDVTYRVDSVIPIREIMSNFIDPEKIESLRDFGWQFSLAKEKGRRVETYFIKAVSPLEYAIHANYHINDRNLPKSPALQKLFESSYADVDRAIKHIKF